MSFGDQFHIDIKIPEDPWDTTVEVNSNAHGAGRLSITPTRTYKGAVKFDPSVFEHGSHCFKIKLGSKYNRGGLPDEVLFHELIHALRGGMEVNDDKQAVSGGLWRYNNTEEFYAVVLTNIYISDKTNKGSSGLRAGHRGKQPLEHYFSKSLCFFASSPQILPLMKKFEAKHGKLFKALSKVKASFNPIRIMVENPKAVENMSKAKITIDHEKTAEKHQKYVEEKRLTQVRAAISAADKERDEQLEAVMSMTPDELRRQMGLLANEALESLLKRIQ